MFLIGNIRFTVFLGINVFSPGVSSVATSKDNSKSC